MTRARWVRRAVAGTAVAGCVLLASCGDGFFFEPAPGPSASLGVRLGAGALAGSQADAFDRADRIAITLFDPSGAPVIAEERSFEPDGTGTRVTLEVELAADEAAFELLVVLRSGSAPLFVGERDVTLRVGESTEASIQLAAVPVAIAAPASLPAFTAFGERRAVDARVTMATGDTIDGAAVGWTSAAPGIVSVEAAPGGGIRAVAVSEGSTELIATHQTGGLGGAPPALEGRVAVEVAVVVDRVIVDPAQLALEPEESGTLTAEARDRNGVPVPGRSFEWSSSDEQVAEVDQTGVVTGVDLGTARIFAAVGNVSGFADVRVDAPEPPPAPTGVSVGWSGGPRLTWIDQSGGTATYRVERAVTPASSPPTPTPAGQAPGFEVIATLPAGSTSFVDPAPVPGVLQYRLRACNPFACSGPSATVAFRYQVPPTVQTHAPSQVTSFSATLVGSVDAHGLVSFAFFELDTSPSFSEPWILPIEGNGIVPPDFGARLVHAVAGDIRSGTTHYVRLVASNDAGLTVGNVVVFTTPTTGGGDAPPPPR